MVVAAAGLGAKAAGRLGIGLTAAYCALGLAITIAIDVSPQQQREAFREVTPVVTAASAPRVLVVSPFAEPFAWYDKQISLLPDEGVRTRSFTLVYTDRRDPPPTLAGFRRAWYGKIHLMPAARYVSQQPRLVRRDSLQDAVRPFAKTPVALLTRH
jgi:hypothetical protein